MTLNKGLDVRQFDRVVFADDRSGKFTRQRRAATRALIGSIINDTVECLGHRPTVTLMAWFGTAGLNVHKSLRAAAAIAERKAWILFLPRYSPDNNPIEMAFSKLKTLLRKKKAKTYDDLWKAVGTVCALFTP
ncbi:hypothetical protein AX761_11055 [Rhizobium sp. 58]|nr:hypothetical protein AX761_11055 [Rhizobium sp. 58]